MKTTSQLTQAVLTKTKHSQTPSSTPQVVSNFQQKSKQVSLVNDLFKIMARRWPVKFRSMYPVDPKAKNPTEILEAAKDEYAYHWKGLKGSMVAKGIQKLRDSAREWPPEPKEFADEYCKPQREDYGLLETNKAWIEACMHCQSPVNRSWSHIAVQLAGRDVGWSTLAGFSQDKQVRKDFGHAYETLVNRCLAGEDLAGTIHKALEDQSSLSVSEASKRYNDQRQQETLDALGIDPDGGREAFKSRLASILGAGRQ